MPRSLIAAAMPRSDVTPLARSSAMTGFKSVTFRSARARRSSLKEWRAAGLERLGMVCLDWQMIYVDAAAAADR
jgi:hypothetical protein